MRETNSFYSFLSKKPETVNIYHKSSRVCTRWGTIYAVDSSEKWEVLESSALDCGKSLVGTLSLSLFPDWILNCAWLFGDLSHNVYYCSSKSYLIRSPMWLWLPSPICHYCSSVRERTKQTQVASPEGLIFSQQLVVIGWFSFANYSVWTILKSILLISDTIMLWCPQREKKGQRQWSTFVIRLDWKNSIWCCGGIIWIGSGLCNPTTKGMTKAPCVGK